ncbi:hypothetical protein HYS49_02375 [Candidatus Woesearchaeota archaeon]|nr:hypothetical protein [Candidatus Woesearchaeota archaeon]
MVRTLEGKHPLYYEAILQLRDVLPETEEFAFAAIKKTGVPVTKIKRIQRGVDVYLADKRIARTIGKQLQGRFGGEQKITMSICGMKDGQDLYRLTILFRGLPFQKGQQVLYKGELCIVSLLGKDILLQEVKTGKKVHVKFKDAAGIKAKNN